MEQPELYERIVAAVESMAESQRGIADNVNMIKDAVEGMEMLMEGML